MRTTDFAPTGSRYYTVARLGEKRSLTPEGYLLCQDVPVGRTGEMLYHEGELLSEDGELVKGGPDGIVRVTRGPEDLFRPETIASFEGKPVTLSHPSDFVRPDNIDSVLRGTMVNVRRGVGIDDDVLLADLLITHAAAIEAVQKDGIEEVSLGYDADYQPLEAGRAAQRNIVGNHVALVERGRCGPRCAIGDEEMAGKREKRTFLDTLMRAFKAKDAAEVEKIAKETEDDEGEEEEEGDGESSRRRTGDAAVLKLLKSMDRKIDSMDERLEKLESEDDDDDGETTDTVLHAEKGEKLDEAGVKLYTGDAAVVIPALAEIIAPGTRKPTLDAQSTDAQRAQALCACQRKALDTAYRTEDGRAVIEPLLGGLQADFEKMPPLALNAIFHGAAQAIRVRNNADATRGSLATRDFGKTVTPASINAAHRKHWEDQRAKR